MKKGLYLIIGIALTLVNLPVEANYYTTLPAGVRALVLRQVETTQINSSFTGNQSKKDYSFNLNIDAPSIQAATKLVDVYLEPLKQMSPEAYNAFSLGEYKIDANAQVSVQALALAYGITNRLTSYISVPYYRAKVSMNMVRTKNNNNSEVKKLVNQTVSGASNQDLASSFLQGATSALPDISGENIQSIIVNYLGYQPLGTWEGQGLGDIDWVFIYRLTDAAEWGMAATAGVTLPTGRTDDPDILQDIPFGDGQTDVFFEFGGGATHSSKFISGDAFMRYTHQFAKEKTLRIPESEDYALGTYKANFKEKLGDKIDLSIGPTMHFTSWMHLNLGYLYNYTFESRYESPYSDANSVLQKDTNQESHTLRAEIGFSTVDSYTKGNFVAPIMIKLSGQKVMAGKNIPDVSRADLEFRLFF